MIDEDRHDAIRVELRYLAKGMDGLSGQLGDIDRKIDKINGRVRDNEKAIAGLQVKAGFWGAVSGAITAALASIVAWVGFR